MLGVTLYSLPCILGAENQQCPVVRPGAARTALSSTLLQPTRVDVLWPLGPNSPKMKTQKLRR